MEQENNSAMSLDSSSTDSSSSSGDSEYSNNYSYDSLSFSPNLFQTATGMKLGCFDELFFPGIQPYLQEKRHKFGPKDVLSVIDEAVMVLVFLRQGFPYKEMGRLFNLSESRIRIIIKEDILEIADLFQDTIEWVDLNSQENHLDENELEGFGSVVGIIDATEIRINRPLDRHNQKNISVGRKRVTV